MALSPLSLISDMRPAALAGRAVDAARQMAAEPRHGPEGKGFAGMMDALDANRDGHLSGIDAIGHAGRGAARVFSAFTGVEIDTSGRDDPTMLQRGSHADVQADEGTKPAHPAVLPSGTVPPTIAGIHQLYDQLRALR
ncbi:hypothetical protein [Maritimibacter sp. DP1N21-5]|uniref:hypothetical protein n=1 Tax=Maritimibacter sp. DP1N21-5 TaxID=2836867 RepID=UPI001C448DA2|nr:hypothetical protein [Maritimibacter sp. DP1N21-5]MBV7407557.1 hypothetical protein [Maritimibacter sp. DP1N21-5]